ncbi:MAG TPA: hypothetical protein VL309_08995 [Vicinamibacterales bacterium]|jgi:hypothetical protein|nr:hypothetical protein [Vicinamibacterales bacterium]
MTQRVAAHRLWIGLLAAPIAWTAQGLLGWFFGARVCGSMSIGSVRLIVGVIGLAALGVALGGLAVGLQNRRGAGAGRPPAADRVEFMALGGLLVSAAFVVAISWAALNAVLVDVCGGMR